MAFNSTSGSATATSYVSVAKAESILGDYPQTPGIVTWLSLSDADKERTLTSATAILEGFNYLGAKCNSTQALLFPRMICSTPDNYATCDEIPPRILIATAFLAAYNGLEGGPTAIEEGSSGSEDLSALAGFDEIQVDVIKVKTNSRTAGYGSNSTENSIPAFVAQLIQPYRMSGLNNRNQVSSSPAGIVDYGMGRFGGRVIPYRTLGNGNIAPY
jgi:hypothetical protein